MVRKLGREHADKNTHNNLYEHLKAVAVLGGADKIQETDVKQPVRQMCIIPCKAHRIPRQEQC